MNKMQIAIVGFVVTGAGVAYMMMSGEAPPAPSAEPEPPSLVDHVLVAARDLPYGAEITDADISWMEWPKGSVPPGVITKTGHPSAREDVKSSYVRVPLSMGEPVRKERLVKGVTPGVMSTMVSPGKRAVAIDITLNSTAGGFILPNDRVDVMHTFRDTDASKERGREVFGSEALLKNVRVLAIGQAIEKKSGDAVVTGSTATLELDPEEARVITSAQRSGQLMLVLRPISDALHRMGNSADASDESTDETITVVKRGASAEIHVR